MKTYEYVVPEGRKVIIPTSHWCKYYAKRGMVLLNRTEAYVTEDRVVFHHVVSPLGKLVFLLILPIVFILGVIKSGVKETMESVLDVLFQKKRGTFSVDNCYSIRNDNPNWDKTMEMIDTLS